MKRMILDDILIGAAFKWAPLPQEKIKKVKKIKSLKMGSGRRSYGKRNGLSSPEAWVFKGFGFFSYLLVSR